MTNLTPNPMLLAILVDIQNDIDYMKRLIEKLVEEKEETGWENQF